MLERFFPSLTSKTGLSPGTVIHVGDKPEKKPRIRLVQYSENSLETRLDVPLAACPLHQDLRAGTWLHIEGLHDTTLITEFGNRYALHPLVLEDLVNTGHQPKLEDLEDYLFIIIKAFDYDDLNQEVIPIQVNLLFNKEVVFSFQEGDRYLFASVDRRIQNNKGRIRRKKGDYLAYVLLDTIVDNYFEIFEKIGDRIETLEEEVLDNDHPASMHKIHALKREVAVMKKSIWPLRELLTRLLNVDPQFREPENEKYFRDLHDHITQLTEVIEVFRETLSGIRDLYLAMVSNKMNEIMKVLTIIATIFIPLTFIAGVYGMNFKYMPELEWRWGYFGIMALMLSCAIGMGLYFRNKKWL